MRVPTESHKGYDHIIGQLGLLIENLKTASGLTPERLGIGTPGTLDPASNRMKNCNATCLNGQTFADDLAKALGIPVKIANDANCFAIAETSMGIIQDECPEAEVVFGVIMGTGVGGGLVVHEKIINGKHGIGGEWGHNYLHASGGLCYCGKTGCVETMISGPALMKYYEQNSGQQLSLKEIILRAAEGQDAHAVATGERLIKYFGRAMASIVNVVDPDAIVLGGGLGNIDILYTLGKQEIEKHVFNTSFTTLLLQPKLGDSAGVFGAALL